MRILELSDDGAEEFVSAMVKSDIDNLTTQLNDLQNWQHPEDRKANKKYLKALKRVYKYYSITTYESPEC